MSSKFEKMKKLVDIQVLASKTSNKLLFNENIKEVLVLTSKTSKKDINSLNKGNMFDVFPDKVKDLINNGIIVKKEDVPVSLLKEMNSDISKDIKNLKIYHRKNLSKDLGEIVDYAIEAPDYLKSFFLNTIGFNVDSMEKTFYESIKDLMDNSEIYKNNLRFNKEKVLELLREETPTIKYEYTFVDLGDLYLLKTNDVNYKKNFENLML